VPDLHPPQPFDVDATGVDHYREAKNLLALSRMRRAMSGPDVGTAEMAEIADQFMYEAYCHAMLAVAAATALTVTVPIVGDSAEVTDWARAVQPSAGNRRKPADYEPEHWPPRHGDIWQDSKGHRWCCQVDGTLASMVTNSDDFSREILAVYGPLRLVSRPSPIEEEAPF
jgi:hypothetical protein